MRQNRDWTQVPSTLTIKSSILWLHPLRKKEKLKFYASQVTYLAGMWRKDAYWKEHAYYKDWQRLDQTGLPQEGLQCLTFTNFPPHYNTKNHTQGWRFNMQMKYTIMKKHIPSTAPVPPTSYISPTPMYLNITYFPPQPL